MSQNVQPIFILPEDTKRTTGRDAQRNNIAAAKAVAETVRTTLGPRGMDKMLVDSVGDAVVTNDGVTILEEMQIEHPAAKMIVEVAKTQENEIGDGTTTAVILAGELLNRAESLIEQNIHPTVIAKGYRMAAETAQKVLNNIAEDIKPDDTETLKKIALTAMTGKGAEIAKEKLADLVVKAVRQVAEENEVDSETIRIEKKVGGGIDDSELIKGIILDKERVDDNTPKFVKNAKIALISSAIEVKSSETDTKISISDASKLQSFVEEEERILKEMVNAIINTKANVVICQKGIDDFAQYYLVKAGIYAVRRVKSSDLHNLAKATGAKVVSTIREITEGDLGKAGSVEEIKIGEDRMTYVQDCKNPKAVTILVRGGTKHVVDEVERALTDAIGDIAVSLKSQKVVAGAGAPEMEVARNLRLYANKMSGREQLAVQAFADSMEIIPRTLAENAGLDPIDVLTELKSEHDAGKKWAGINVLTGKVEDAWKMGVIEPLKIKTQAVKSASEVAELILRIDDVIAASNLSKEPQMPQGGYPGMM